MMNFVQNFPCFSILFSMFAAIVSSALKGKQARKLSIALSVLVAVMSFMTLTYIMGTGESFVYIMGHFPAPWGNEIRAGLVETGISLLFALITLFGLLGGIYELELHLDEEKISFYYIMVDLMLASNLALVYTNDLFTAYVFVEISTIAACGLIISRSRSSSIAAGIRYMIMSMMGSGLVLLGICFLYDLSGQLLMQPAKEAVQLLFANGEYHVPLLFAIAIISIGLAIKSALWPFHTWLPEAYGYSTPASSAMLSSIVSKGYIILLIKIIIRVVGLENYNSTAIIDILLVFGLIGMIIGSVDAIRQQNLRRMIAFSSVAQIGYIFMGIGIGTEAAMQASIYHIFAHSTAKALAFTAAAGLIRANGGDKYIDSLYGAGFKNKIAGVGFVVASLSMIGIPGFGGFVSKVMFAEAAFGRPSVTMWVLLALAISTILNAAYFMHVVLVIYTPITEKEKAEGMSLASVKNAPSYIIAIVGFIAANLIVGICTGPMLEIVKAGLQMLG